MVRFTWECMVIIFLTDDGKVDAGVHGDVLAEVDATPIHRRVRLARRTDDQRGGGAVEQEGGAVPQHAPVPHHLGQHGSAAAHVVAARIEKQNLYFQPYLNKITFFQQQ